MICNAFHLTLLASLLPFAAFAKTFHISPLPESPYADTEVTTNIAFNTNRGDVKEFELEFTLDCTLSNCVQVALGIDVNRDGELSFAETGAVLGWRNGRYFIEDVENGKRYEYPVESESRIGIEVFTVNLRTKRGGVDASAWLYNPNWNLMKITRRGRDMPSEWIRCKLDYSGFYITIR